MSKVLLVVAICLCYVFSHGIRQRVYYEKEFFNYQRKFHIDISNSDEYLFRLNNFIQALDIIDSHNLLPGQSYKLGLNRFAILTKEEARQQLFTELPKETNTIVKSYSHVNAPDSIDWVDNGVVTSVKDQSSCGSCWAFSAVASIESIYKMKKDKLVDLSVQQLVDCDTNNDGCGGGLRDVAMDYVMENGLCLWDDYPYTATDGKCKTTCKPETKLTGHHTIKVSENELKNVLAIQPPSIGIAADYIMYYESGIYDGTCTVNINHGVQAVGYGEEKGVKFWKIKNSWGGNWGEKGYFRLIRTEKDVPGICNVAGRVHVPELDN